MYNYFFKYIQPVCAVLIKKKIKLLFVYQKVYCSAHSQSLNVPVSSTSR